eukprot:8242288-Pyramimonas_sp.AAC.2
MNCWITSYLRPFSFRVIHLPMRRLLKLLMRRTALSGSAPASPEVARHAPDWVFGDGPQG